VQSFTVRIPLLAATSAFGLVKKRCLRTAQESVLIITWMSPNAGVLLDLRWCDE